MKNYKKEVSKWIIKYSYDSKVVWNKTKRQLIMTIVGKDKTTHVLTKKTYSELDIAKNFIVYLNDFTTKNFNK